MELMICFYPFLFYLVLAFYPALYWLDLNFPLNTISGVSTPWRNPLTVVLCCALDVTVVATYLTWVSFTFFMILSFVMTFVQTADAAIFKTK
jgi:hypothetical protein